MLNSASGFRHPFFNDRREDRFEARHPFFNDRLEDRLEARRFFHNRSTFVFIGDFGFPWWWGWGWGPWWGWNWGYPYGYGGGYYGSGYYGNSGYGYNNGYGNSSSVTELQRKLADAGYYHGPIDGIMGSRTQHALRAYQYDRRNGNIGGSSPTLRSRPYSPPPITTEPQAPSE